MIQYWHNVFNPVKWSNPQGCGGVSVEYIENDNYSHLEIEYISAPCGSSLLSGLCKHYTLFSTECNSLYNSLQKYFFIIVLTEYYSTGIIPTPKQRE